VDYATFKVDPSTGSGQAASLPTQKFILIGKTLELLQPVIYKDFHYTELED
jgi:hypothetical protein